MKKLINRFAETGGFFKCKINNFVEWVYCRDASCDICDERIYPYTQAWVYLRYYKNKTNTMNIVCLKCKNNGSYKKYLIDGVMNSERDIYLVEKKTLPSDAKPFIPQILQSLKDLKDNVTTFDTEKIKSESTTDNTSIRGVLGNLKDYKDVKEKVKIGVDYNDAGINTSSAINERLDFKRQWDEHNAEKRAEFERAEKMRPVRELVNIQIKKINSIPDEEEREKAKREFLDLRKYQQMNMDEAQQLSYFKNLLGE